MLLYVWVLETCSKNKELIKILSEEYRCRMGQKSSKEPSIDISQLIKGINLKELLRSLFKG